MIRSRNRSEREREANRFVRRVLGSVLALLLRPRRGGEPEGKKRKGRKGEGEDGEKRTRWKVIELAWLIDWISEQMVRRSELPRP
jgi:hypothetical protein